MYNPYEEEKVEDSLQKRRDSEILNNDRLKSLCVSSCPNSLKVGKDKKPCNFCQYNKIK